jgi:hypothetical protein
MRQGIGRSLMRATALVPSFFSGWRRRVSPVLQMNAARSCSGHPRLDRGGSKIGCAGRGERLDAEGGMAELMDFELLER